MSFIIQGVPNLQRAMAAMVVRQNAATRTATSKAAHHMEREIKAELSLGSHRRGEPTTSEPGTPPDMVSGDLRRSVQVDGPWPHAPSGWEAEVGPTIEYGRIQELGGETGRHGATYLPPRPYVEPTLEKNQAEIAAIYREAWAAALRG